MKPCELLVICIFCTFPNISAKAVRNPKSYNRCPKVTIPNGTMVLKFRGRVAKFTCDPGYQLIGDRIATCQLRSWDAIPSCVEKVKCPEEKPKVLNGLMIPYQFVYFKMVCNPGYNVSQDSQTIFPCEEFYAPNHRQMVCQLTEKNFCDFEEGMCGWNNTIPFFSWIRHQNATPSHDLHTGPSSDHTTGTGHYLYIEASGLSEYEERFAKLTRRFSRIETPEVCFVFWYHMYGFNIGTLDVYVDYKKVFTKTGNLGNKWRKGIIQNLPSEHDFYISFVATTANGYAGDIAIDDIGLVNSTDCTKTLLVERSCRYRCFDPEPNATLCKCSSECLIESNCCEDFVRYCSLEPYEPTIRPQEESTDYQFTDRDTSESQSSDVDAYPTVPGLMYEIVTESYTSDSSMTYETTSDGINTPTSSGEIEVIHSATDEIPEEEFNDVIKITEAKIARFTQPARQNVQESRIESTSGSYSSGEHETSVYEASSEESTIQDSGNSGFDGTSNTPTENSEYDPTAEAGTEPSILEVQASPSLSTDANIPAQTDGEMVSHPASSTETMSGEAKKKLPSSINKTTNRSKIEISSTTPKTALKFGPPGPATTAKPDKLQGFQPNATILSRKDGKQITINATTRSEQVITTTTTNAPAISERIITTTTAMPKAEPRMTPTTEAATSSKTQATTSTAAAGSTKSVNSEATDGTTVSTTGTDQPTPSSFEYETDISSPRRSYEDAVWTEEPSGSDEYHDLTDSPEPSPKIATTTGSNRSPDSPRLAAKTPYKWKSSYVPKGRYTFSAVKSETHTKAYVSISIGILLFLSAAILTGYLFSRRRRSTPRRLRDDCTEESDVLYMTADDALNFNVGLPSRPQSGHLGKQRKGDRKQLSPSSSDLSL
ncbi:Scavenger receptor [Nesidiocoris tenuis]|uniref:Scavenger receptor n=1 Tax=Nesidiocoris tenuis TaxID=355587 RepID=A0ABN7B932_9HEMI|nr:Scavenger receptor [Nesidiocoris tenuis]